MLGKISHLCFLCLLCLPMVGDAEELISPHFSKNTEFSDFVTRAKRTRHFSRCKPKPPICPCIPGSQGPSSLGTLAYGDFYVSLLEETEIFGPGEIIPISTPRANLNIQGLSVDPLTGGIIVSVPGIYEISYVVTIIPLVILPPSPLTYTIALQLDGVILPGSARSVLALQDEAITTQIQIQGQVLQTLQAGQVVSVVNADTESLILLGGAIFSPASVEQASLIIRKIDNLP